MAKMKDFKPIIFLAVTIILVVSAALVVLDKTGDTQREQTTGFFLPKLQGNVDNIATIVLFNKGTQTTIRKIGGQWLLVGKYNYIVDPLTIRKLIVTSKSLETLEKKTDKTERFETLGVGDYTDKESPAVRILMANATDDEIYADFIRGMARGFGKLENENAVYVRNTNENQVWLAKGDFTFLMNANFLLNKSEYKIDKDRMMKLSVSHPIGEDYTLYRMNPKVDFDIMQPSKPAESNNELNRMALILDGGLDLVDVEPESEKKLDRKDLSVITYKTYDGLEVVINALDLEKEGVWIRISAIGTKDAVKSEAQKINSVAKGWVYKVSGSTAELLMRQLVDIEAKSKPNNR